MQVIDLRATPPRVSQVVEAGAGPSGVSINRAGNLVLVANRNAGTVSVFRFANGALAPVSTVTIGNATSSPAHVQFTPDGRRALVTRDDAAASFVTVLNVEGETVTKTDRDITAGIRPYGMGITADGRWAVAANIGRGGGDADTVTLIDLRREPYLAADTISVGPTPEGIQVSPDNRHVAVTTHNGSARPQGHPLRGRAQLIMLRIDNGRLREVARAPIGDWAQGIAFSRDGAHDPGAEHGGPEHRRVPLPRRAADGYAPAHRREWRTGGDPHGGCSGAGARPRAPLTASRAARIVSRRAVAALQTKA